MGELRGNDHAGVTLQDRLERLATKVPNVNAWIVAPNATDGQQLPVRTEGQTEIADIRAHVFEHTPGFEVQDHDSRRRPFLAVDSKATAFLINRQVVKRKLQRQPPYHPAGVSVPDGDAPLERTIDETVATRIESRPFVTLQLVKHLTSFQIPDPKKPVA